MTARSLLCAVVASAIAAPAFAQQRAPEQYRELQQSMSSQLERGLDEPFKGVTTNGTPVAGLFPLRSTGVSTEPVNAAARAFLSALLPEQRGAVQFAVDDEEW